MIEYVKVEKGNVKKTIEKQLLRQYVSAGWKQVVETKVEPKKVETEKVYPTYNSSVR